MKSLKLTILFVACVLAFTGIRDAFAMQTFNSNSAGAPTNSDYINDYALTLNTAKMVTWPTTATTVRINCIASFWSSLQSGIVIPVSDVTDGTGEALTVATRHRGSETAFYLISATSQVCSAEFWGN